MMPAGAFDNSNTCALRGPRGGIVLSSVEYADAEDKGCPAVLGGPLPHVMAAQVAASVRRFVSTGCFVSSSRTRCRSR
jgi:glycine/serine hydroxymethyltransferase